MSKNLKILQVIDTLNVGGGERVFIDMCSILIENNVNVKALFLLNPGMLQNELDKRIILTFLNRTSKWSFIKMFECSKILKQNDIVHCHFRHVYKYIKLVAILFNIKATIILHDHYGSIDLDKKVPFLFSSFLKPTKYIGVSESLCFWAIESLKVNSKNVFKLQNLILKTDKKILNKFNSDIVLVSNIKVVKNNKFALEIIKNSNYSLVMLGRVQDENYYKEIIRKNDILNDRLQFNHSISAVQPFLNNFKMGLHTSFSESGPLVLIEYLAQGLPFLAYETGEIAKVLKTYFPEYFIDNFIVEEWIKRINSILETPINTKLMEDVFVKHFSKQHYFKMLMKIYNE